MTPKGAKRGWEAGILRVKRREGVGCSLQGSDTAVCGILVGEKRSYSGVIAELHRRNYNGIYFGTQSHGDTERIFFKFSEDTENLKTPWLCGYYIRMVIL